MTLPAAAAEISGGGSLEDSVAGEFPLGLLVGVALPPDALILASGHLAAVSAGDVVATMTKEGREICSSLIKQEHDIF